jgi:hypothetical protein
MNDEIFRIKKQYYSVLVRYIDMRYDDKYRYAFSFRSIDND